MAYDDAVSELYQVPLSQFIAERKRLADELKASGDAAGAKQLGKRGRPPISAWVVNQLYWHARDAFDEMLATAERLRQGDLKASAPHREAIANLRKRAAAMLEDSGHNASESTLRRVTTTLSALAATGGFEPDLPGTLATDRDPPGFEAVGIPLAPVEREEPAEKKHDGRERKDEEDAKRAAKEAEARLRDEMAEKKRVEEERRQRALARHKLEAGLNEARSELDQKQRAVTSLEKQLDKARKEVERAQEIVDDFEARLGELAES